MPINPDRLRPAPAAGERAAALVMVLLFITVLTVVAGSLLLTTSSHYHNTYQSASWQEAIVAAEAGVDMAMAELRKRVIVGAPSAFRPASWTRTAPNGKAYIDSGCAFPANNQPYALVSHGGEGNNTMSVRVFVDVPGSGIPPVYAEDNFAVATPDTATFVSQPEDPAMRDTDGYDRSRWWYRIRSLGIAGIAGPARVNLDGRDNLLRRLSFFTDWRTGQPVASAQAARMVEVIVKPQSNFRNALMADVRIDLKNQDVLIDSYDSTKGDYNPASNVGEKGNIATNGTLINAGQAVVKGDAMTNNGSVADAEGVTGAQRTDFYQELTPIKPLTDFNWTRLPVGPIVMKDTTYTASTDKANPTRIRLSGVNLPTGGYTMRIAGQKPAKGATTAPSTYVKIYVEGDIVTRGQSAIELEDGVNAIIYVTGNVDLQGDGIVNDSTLPGRLVINGVQPPANADGTYPARSISIATNQDFEGMVYAPSHDVNLDMIVYDISLLGGLLGGSSSGSSGSGSGGTSGSNTSGSNVSGGGSGSGDDGTGKIPKHKPLKKLLSQDAEHLKGYNGIYGAFIGKTITVQNKTHVHYDESLSQIGPINHYEITNWFEDTVGSNAAGGAPFYWWAPAPTSAPQF